MKFLKKTVTLKINIFALVTVLLLLGSIAASVHFHVPENLFFTMLSPEMIESIQISMGSGEYEDLTDQEIEAFVEVLKDFRIHTNGVHGCTPYTLTRTDYRIHMKWGQTLPFSFRSGTMNFGEYIYPNYADVDDRLYELYRQQRTVRKGK